MYLGWSRFIPKTLSLIPISHLFRFLISSLFCLLYYLILTSNCFYLFHFLFTFTYIILYFVFVYPVLMLSFSLYFFFLFGNLYIYFEDRWEGCDLSVLVVPFNLPFTNSLKRLLSKLVGSKKDFFVNLHLPLFLPPFFTSLPTLLA